MKKIVHVTSAHTPFDPRIFLKECVSLVEAGYEVSLIAPHDHSEVSSGVSIIPIQRGTSRLRRMVSTARSAISCAAAEQADLYHVHDPELLPWCRKLRKQGVPVVYDMHEDLPFQIRFKAWIPGFFRPGLAKLAGVGERALLNGSPIVFAEKSYHLTRPWIKEYVEVLNYPRFDLLETYSRDERDTASFRIGYMGAVTSNRGSIRTLEALKIAQGVTGRQIEFECIGNINPSHQSQLVSFVSEHGITGVRFLGYLPPHQGWARMASFDVGLAILAPIPNYLGSYPTKLFEYMSLGIPSIVSDFPLYREIVEKYSCGMVVDPSNSQSLARAIVELMENPDLAKTMGARGKAAAREFFCWESEEDKLTAFYSRLMKE